MKLLEQALLNLNLGKIRFKPFVVTCDKRIYSDEIWEESGIDYIRINCRYEDEFTEEFHFQIRGNEIICRCYFGNQSESIQEIIESGCEFNGIDFGKHPGKDYFYHTENPRIYERMTFAVDYNRSAEDVQRSEFDAQAGNRWADPGVVCDRIGRSPYQPFPAILLSNYGSNSQPSHRLL